MKAFFMKIKERMRGSPNDFDIPEDIEEGYLELPAEGFDQGKPKVTVQPFILEDFADVKPILDALREGYTIAMINIKPLKDQDLVELKRAINKLKKTCDALEGDIAGFGEDWICVTPSFARIHRERKAPEPSTTSFESDDLDYY